MIITKINRDYSVYRIMIYNDLALFLAVAHHLNFAKAAQALNIPPSRLSRKIADLEGHFGMKLFERTTRQVRLTEEGRLLLDRAQAPMEMLQDLGGHFANDQQEQTIHITASSLAARTTLSPILFDFMQANPTIKIDLTTSNQYLDFVRDNIDLAFRVGPLDDSNLIAKKLWDVPYSFCIQEEFLTQRGLSHHLSQAEFKTLPSIGFKQGWLLDSGKIIEPSTMHHCFDDLELVLTAAQKGLGIALMPDMMIDSPLVPITIEGMQPTLRALYVVYPSRRLLPERVRRLIDFCS